MQFPKELQPPRRWGRSPRPSRLNEVQFPKELQPEPRIKLLLCVLASMKCSSRRNCNRVPGWVTGHDPRLNEVQFPKELQHGVERRQWVLHLASMKCSSRRNCNSPLSIARQQAHLRALRERSSRSLRLSPARLLLCSPHSRHSNVLLPRALPRVLRALERSRQAISGPSGVMVLVRPT